MCAGAGAGDGDILILAFLYAQHVMCLLSNDELTFGDEVAHFPWCHVISSYPLIWGCGLFVRTSGEVGVISSPWCPHA